MNEMNHITARIVLTGALLAGLLVTAGCQGGTSKEPPIHAIRNMYQQARYTTQTRSDFFDDGRAMRPIPAGTVAREMEMDIGLATGVMPGGEFILEVPLQVVRRGGGMETMLDRGEERYGIYCAPCHGDSGNGRGVVAVRAGQIGAGAMTPPTFHDDRLRTIPDGQLFATISNGIRNMPAYKHNVPVDDRWAIVAYVRALQISQATAPTAKNLETEPSEKLAAAAGAERGEAVQ